MPIETTLVGDKEDFFKMHLLKEIDIAEDAHTIARLIVYLACITSEDYFFNN